MTQSPNQPTDGPRLLDPAEWSYQIAEFARQTEEELQDLTRMLDELEAAPPTFRSGDTDVLRRPETKSNDSDRGYTAAHNDADDAGGERLAELKRRIAEKLTSAGQA